MMKVFLDTNILLDYGLDREKADFAGGILQLGKDGLIELYASYLSYANIRVSPYQLGQTVLGPQ